MLSCTRHYVARLFLVAVTFVYFYDATLVKSSFIRFVKNKGACNLTTFGYPPSGDNAKLNQLLSTTLILQKSILEKVIGNETKTKIDTENRNVFLPAVAPGLTRRLRNNAPSFLYTLEAFISTLGFLPQRGKSGERQIISSFVTLFIQNFTEVVLEHIDVIKDYIENCTINAQKNFIKTEFRKMLYLWLTCVFENDTNSCQNEALKYVRSSAKNFLYFDKQRKKSETLDICSVKRLEMELLALRDYTFITILMSESVIGSYEEKGGTVASGIIKSLLLNYISDLADFEAYTKWAFDNINRVHLINRCDVTSNCTITPIYKGSDENSQHVTNVVSCSCNLDQTMPKQLCYAIFVARIDEKKLKKPFYQVFSIEGDPNKAEAFRNLTSASSVYQSQVKGYMKAFWDNEILNFIPLWQKLLKNAVARVRKVSLSKENKKFINQISEDDDVESYSTQFEERLKNFKTFKTF